MTKLLALCSVNADDIENLLDDAFGRNRQRRTAYQLRTDMPIIGHLSFAVIDSGAVVGSIQCWPIRIADSPLILVGPVAVSSQLQNQGIGRLLMRATLDAALSTDPPMVMIGDPGYYNRFGFIADETGGWTLPGPWEAHRLLLRNPDATPLPKMGLLGPRL